jgi:hypothetical protein
MRKLRIFVVELILVGLLVAWFFEKFPQSVDKFIPWIMFAILWHLTWEIVDVGHLRSKAERIYERWGSRYMTWILVFCAGGMVSLMYWYSVRLVLAKLENTKPSAQIQAPTTALSPNDVPKQSVQSTPKIEAPTASISSGHTKQQLEIAREQLALNYVPQVSIRYENNQIQIYNYGRTNITLWGCAYGDIHAGIEKEFRTIVPNTFYYLYANELEPQMRRALHDNQVGTTPLRVFIKTQNDKRYTVNALLVGELRNGVLSIRTQDIGSESGWRNLQESTVTQVERVPSTQSTPSQSNVPLTQLDRLVETNKHLPKVDRERLAEALFEFSKLFDQANELWGKVNLEGGTLSHSWNGELNNDLNVDTHINKLRDLKQMATNFRESFRNLQEKWHYFEPQINYILGDAAENIGPNSLMNATDDYRQYLESWKTIANKGGRNATMYQATQNQYDTSVRNFALWKQACEGRLQQMRDSLL